MSDMPVDPGDLGGLLGELGRLQRELQAASELAEMTEVVGSAGGGAVRVVVRGDFDFRRVEIAEAFLAEADRALVEDMVLAALRDATTRLLASRRAALDAAVGPALGALFEHGAAPDDAPGQEAEGPGTPLPPGAER